MNPAALLSDLAGQGVILEIRGGALAYRAPKGVLTPEALERMREQKEGLLAILAGAEVEASSEWRPKLGGSSPAVWGDGRCVRCESRRWRWSAERQRWECANPTCEPDGQRLWGRRTA